MIDYLHSPPLLLSLAGVLGLIVGSFLNVVIHRLPIMMEQRWRQEARDYLAEGPSAAPAPPAEAFNLLVPRSRCPYCSRPISALENIPVFSYLLLRGRCAGCKERIPLRYPIIEIAAGLLAVAVAWRFGPTTAGGAALVLTWALLCLSAIDIDRQLLPDSITLPLLWLGLLLSLGGVFVGSHAGIIGAAAGYLALWLVYMAFKLLTRKEGMGHGDFKLLAALGAWLGWQALPLIILLSSVVGAAIGLALILVRGRDRNVPIPFGPYLAAAGWITLMWGDSIAHAYLAWLGA